MSNQLYTHRKTGAVHKLLEVYQEHNPLHEGGNKAGNRMAVIVSLGFCDPLTPTNSWLGNWQTFRLEFEQVK